MRNTCSTRKKSQDSSNYKNLKSLKKRCVLDILAKGTHTFNWNYGIWIQNKNTWLSRSRRWMSLKFSFHGYLFFIRVSLICRKQRRFCNCCMYFPRCFFIRSVENITTTFSEFLFQYFRFFVSFLLSHWTSVLCFFISRRRPWNTLQDKILLLIWRASIDVIKLSKNYLWFNHALLSQKSWW